MPWSLVDTSVKQFDQGRITEATVLRAARDPRSSTVVVTDPNRLGRWPDLADRLGELGFRTVADRDGVRVLVRGCTPHPG